MATQDASTDGMIVAAVLAGDQEQFTKLVHRYQPALFRVARSRLGRDDWADDAVQETFFCAIKWLRTYDSRYSFRTWLWTILLNQCHRKWKKQSRDHLVGTWPEDHTTIGASAVAFQSNQTPPDHLLARERTQLLDSILRELPEVYADAVRLRFYGDLKFQEIAAAMGCSISTAKNRVKWGLLKLAELLGPEGRFAHLGLSDLEKGDEGRS